MTNQTNPGIYIPQRQLTLLLISIMLTISAAIIFSAIFVTNLVQGQVASALSAQPAAPAATQTAAYKTQPMTLADAELSYDDLSTNDAYTGCSVPTSSQPSSSEAISTASLSAPKNAYKRNKSANDHPIVRENTSNTNNTYNNDYSKTSSTKNIDNSVNYSHSFNQGSYNEVKGNLTQTNTNNNSNGDTKIIDSSSDDHGKSNGYDKDDKKGPKHGPVNKDKTVTLLSSSQPVLARD
jgi:hypothetical protein